MSAKSDSHNLLNEALIEPWLTKKTPWVTYMLISINVIVFVVMAVGTRGTSLFEPTGQQLLAWGANFAPLTFAGEDWRLVTSGFLHIGFLHLAMNMYVLLLFGKICERLFGHTKFFVIYMISGVAAALCSDLQSILFKLIVSAGASGSICGVLGAHFSFIRFHRLELADNYKPLVDKFKWYAIATLLYGFFVHADHAAHIGGVLCGILLGAWFVPKGNDEPLRFKQLTLTALLVLALTGLWYLESSGALDLEGTFNVCRIQYGLKLRSPNDAVNAYQKIVERYPCCELALLELGGEQLKLNENQAALTTAEKLIEQNPSNYQALSLAALAAFRDGSYDACRAYFKKIPADNPAHNKIAAYCIARIDGANGKIDTALAEAKLDPAETEQSDLLIYSQAGMDSEADRIADRLLLKNPNDRSAQFIKYIAQWRQRNYKQAMKIAHEMEARQKGDPQNVSYAAFTYAIAGKMAGEAHPELLIENDRKLIDQDPWTAALADYLLDRISAPDLIKKAVNKGQKTEAYAYAGLNNVAEQKAAAARPYLEWAVKNGLQNYYEQWLARTELERLNGQGSLR